MKNYAYRNGGNLAFENVSEKWGLDEFSYANDDTYTDLDNDGDLDLIVNNVDSKASVFRNSSEQQNQNHSFKISFEGSEHNKAGIGAKISAWIDGELLLFENYPVRGYLSSMPKDILIGLGKSKKIDSLLITWPDGKVQKKYAIDSTSRNLTIKYSQADQTIHPVLSPNKFFQASNGLLDFEHKEFNYVDFNQTATLHKMLSKSGPTVAKADINGDSIEDLAIGGSLSGNETQIFTQDKSGKFKKVLEIPTSKNMEVGAIHFFDADKDGDQDLIFAGGSCERPLNLPEAFQPQLWTNDGKGNFKIVKDFPAIHVSSHVITTLDIDNDNDLDIFIGGRVLPNEYPDDAKSYILRNDSGKFVDATSQIAPFLNKLGMVCDAKAIDIDKNGYKDLVVVGEWMPLTILKNNKGQLTLSQKQKTEGWWNIVEVADLNKDGIDDLVLGNEA